MGDEEWMAKALDFAALGRGVVEPNPLVGAVVVDGDGHMVGQGYHDRFGGFHAEVHALREAGASARGGTLYVTLEPCCHFGKTPPCTDAIIAAGVRRVVAAMRDPFAAVDGGGFAALRAAAIDVVVGVGETAARVLNAPFVKLVSTGTPYVHAKWAMTLDGRVATRTGSSKWISNDASRQVVHALRSRMDAIIVGRGTVVADDPLLTARPPGPRTPARVVIAPSGELPLECQLSRTASEGPVIVYTAHPERVPWREANVVNLVGLDAILADLGRRRFTNVLLEGGPKLLGAFFDAGRIDEVHAFIAPKLAGGGPSPLGGAGVAEMCEAWELHDVRVQSCGTDIYLHGRTR